MLRRVVLDPLVRLLRATETVSLLLFAMLLIKLLPFRFWRGLLGPVAQNETAPSPLHGQEAARAMAIGRRVRRIARKSPVEFVCLPQALAARWMLRMRGLETDLFIGAKRNDDDRATELHAWLMFADICLTGGAEREAHQAFSKG